MTPKFIKLLIAAPGYDPGFIPCWLSPYDERPAREQLNEHYQNGGGWRPFSGFTLEEDNSLSYPDDPPLPVLFSFMYGEEMIAMYQSSWVAIIQPDRSFEVCRMD